MVIALPHNRRIYSYRSLSRTPDCVCITVCRTRPSGVISDEHEMGWVCARSEPQAIANMLIGWRDRTLQRDPLAISTLWRINPFSMQSILASVQGLCD